MSVSTSPEHLAADRDLHTPRPTAEQNNNNNPEHSQDESASPSSVGGTTAPAHDGRKSFSSLSARSSVSLSTSYSSADDVSEVGELPDDAGHASDIRVQMERHSSGSGETSTKREDQADGQVEKLEQQMADLDVERAKTAENHEDEQEDDDAYLNDPLVKYTLQLHDYTVSSSCARSFPIVH